MTTEIEFNALAAQGYNRIPMIKETYADLDTTLGIYLKLAHSDKSGGKMSCLLESVVGGERSGRYSFIGLPAHTYIRTRDGVTEVVKHGEVIESDEGDPLEFIRLYRARLKVANRPGMPRFTGGLIGYFGYDTIRYIEPKLGPQTKPFPHGMGEDGVPDILLMHTDECVIVDNVIGRTYLLVYADPSEPEAYTKAQKRLLELRTKLRSPVEIPYSLPSLVTQESRDFAKEDYKAAVRKALDHIHAGDLMQVEVGQVVSKPFADSPLSLYRSLRSLNPSPYMYFYNFGDFHMVGSSPEILVKDEPVTAADGSTQHMVTMRPLAGTRKRGDSPARDQELREELQNDPKERAEHLMLIDLCRNDIGRISKTGSVKVTETMAVEKYSHVMHMVSNVTGILKEDMDAIDILRATFPAGTLSGTPKVKSMEIIDELEPVRRGAYGGAAGYLSYNGSMDLAIVIRTAIIKNGMLYAQAAAGIVADSDPEAEWQETEAKVRAVLRAAEQVQYGLDQPI
ncbi:anthranilate synthase component I family protein [Brackiella oedipodis]|uniref:anthranilate synthase component I family protein n=1 Tax=Brackiella oedipodis TaxID=124225 RepID=UPI00048D61B8|nr:anthranilate synthase component I family protein [Brackiella oedipodis]